MAPQFDVFGAPLPSEDLEHNYSNNIFDEVDDILAFMDISSGGNSNFRGWYFLNILMYVVSLGTTLLYLFLSIMSKIIDSRFDDKRLILINMFAILFLTLIC